MITNSENYRINIDTVSSKPCPVSSIGLVIAMYQMDGYNVRQISERFIGISYDMCRKYASEALSESGSKTQAQLVAKCLTNGWVVAK